MNRKLSSQSKQEVNVPFARVKVTFKFKTLAVMERNIWNNYSLSRLEYRTNIFLQANLVPLKF